MKAGVKIPYCFLVLGIIFIHNPNSKYIWSCLSIVKIVATAAAFLLFQEMNAEQHHSSENKCWCKHQLVLILNICLFFFHLSSFIHYFCWIINFVSLRNSLDKLFVSIYSTGCIQKQEEKTQQRTLEGITQYV